MFNQLFSSQYQLLFSQIYAAASLISVFGLGVMVLAKNNKNIVNRLFFLITLVFAIWQLGTFMMLASTTDAQIIFWDRFIYLGVVFMPALQYHFSLVVTSFSNKRKNMLNLAYVLSFLFLILSKSDYFVSDVFKYTWGVHTKAQILHHFFLAYFFFYIFALLYNFYHKRTETQVKIERLRMAYFVTAFMILNLVGGLGYLPAYSISIYPISFIAPLMFSILISYAIIRYRLLNIYFIVTESAMFLTTVSLLIIVFSAAKMFFNNFLLSYGDIAAFVVTIIAVIPIKKITYDKFQKYIFKKRYRYVNAIVELSGLIKNASFLPLDEFVKNILNKTKEILESESSGVMIFVSNNKCFGKEGICFGDIQPKDILLPEKSILFRYLSKNLNEIVNIDEIDYRCKTEKLDDEFKKMCMFLIEELRLLNFEIAVPVSCRSELSAILFFGKKKDSDEGFTVQDFEILSYVGQELGHVIEASVEKGE